MPSGRPSRVAIPAAIATMSRVSPVADAMRLIISGDMTDHLRVEAACAEKGEGGGEGFLGYSHDEGAARPSGDLVHGTRHDVGLDAEVAGETREHRVGLVGAAEAD